MMITLLLVLAQATAATPAPAPTPPTAVAPSKLGGGFGQAKPTAASKAPAARLKLTSDDLPPKSSTAAAPSSAGRGVAAFSGTGKEATGTFELAEGLYRFDLTHEGKSNFIVHLLDSKGRTVDLLTNEIGAFSGAKAVRIATHGSYLLNVAADGEWSVRVSNPGPK